MTKYEYRVFNLAGHDIEEKMSAAGKNGYRAVHTTSPAVGGEISFRPCVIMERAYVEIDPAPLSPATKESILRALNAAIPSVTAPSDPK